MSASHPGGTPPPPAPPQPSAVPPRAATTRPPLRRPREGRILAGVGAGLADHLGMDVAIVRVLIVVITIVTQGLGLLAYLAGALLIPSDDAPAAVGGAGSPQAPAASRPQASRGAAFWLGIGLLVVGVLALLDGPLAFVGWSPLRLTGVIGPLVLIGFGLALWVSSDRSRATVAPAYVVPAPPTDLPSSSSVPPASASAADPIKEISVSAATTNPNDTSSGSSAWSPTPTGDPVTAGGSGAPPAAPAPPAPTATSGDLPAPAAAPDTSSEAPVWTPPPVPGSFGGGGGRGVRPTGQGSDWTPSPAPVRERSLLGRLTIGLALLVAGVLWMLDLADVIRVDGVQVLAATLLVIGVGLLVGSVVGRARWLIIIGLILLPLVLVGSVLRANFDGMEIPFGGGFGERNYAPQSADEVPQRIELAAGSIRIDLTAVDDTTATVPLDVRVGAGEVELIVAEGAGLELTAGVQIGVIDVLGTTSEGFPGVRQLGDELGDARVAAPGQPTFDVDIRIGAGELTVRERPAAVDRDDLSDEADATGLAEITDAARLAEIAEVADLVDMTPAVTPADVLDPAA